MALLFTRRRSGDKMATVRVDFHLSVDEIAIALVDLLQYDAPDDGVLILISRASKAQIDQAARRLVRSYGQDGWVRRERIQSNVYGDKIDTDAWFTAAEQRIREVYGL